MYKVTREQAIGYCFMIIGFSMNIINFIVNGNSPGIFGNFFVYVISGFVFATGLTLVFGQLVFKKEGENGEKVSDNKN